MTFNVTGKPIALRALADRFPTALVTDRFTTMDWNFEVLEDQVDDFTDFCEANSLIAKSV